MPRAIIHINERDALPKAQLVPTSIGGFVALHFTEDLAVYLPGYDRAAIAAARALADALTTAADQLETKLAALVEVS